MAHRRRTAEAWTDDERVDSVTWCLIIAMDDDQRWTDRNAVRGILAFDSREEAEERLAGFRELHPEKSAGVEDLVLDDDG